MSYRKTDIDTYGTRIRELRRIKHITQEKLAASCGRSVTWIAKIETGDRIPTLKAIELISSALDVTPAYLALWENDPHGKTTEGE